MISVPCFQPFIAEVSVPPPVKERGKRSTEFCVCLTPFRTSAVLYWAVNMFISAVKLELTWGLWADSLLEPESSGYLRNCSLWHFISQPLTLLLGQDKGTACTVFQSAFCQAEVSATKYVVSVTVSAEKTSCVFSLCNRSRNTSCPSLLFQSKWLRNSHLQKSPFHIMRCEI